MIYEMKAKMVGGGPCGCAFIAEAVMDGVDGGKVYVTIQDADGKEFTVAKQSVYAFLAEEADEPAEEFMEEYRSLRSAKKSAYAGVFEKLNDMLKVLG